MDQSTPGAIESFFLIYYLSTSFELSFVENGKTSATFSPFIFTRINF